MVQRAALFPGQGSQHVGMGAELAESFPEARQAFERADDVLGFPLSRLCWEGPEDELTQTQNAQPAILVHSLAVWSVVARGLAGSVRFAAGHSLGEFSAYAAAGSLELEDAVRLVRRRGELMAEAREGTMAAVLKLDDEAVEEACKRVRDEGGVVVAANFNAPGQVVVSGEVEAVDKVTELVHASGGRAKPLPVSGAFHSPLMAEAEKGLREALEDVEFKDPAFPIVANATAQPIGDAAAARAALVQQLTAPVRWTECIRRIAGGGVTQFVELGPGKVLTGLLRRVDESLEGIAIGKPEQVERFKEGEV
jgi:[acyl-carrier-protein] S-malonyltransferase